MFIFSIGFIVFKDFLPLIFTENEEVIKIASTLLIIAGLFQLSDGLQAVILGGLRGLQDVNIPSLLAFIAYWIVGFPICYYLGKHTELGTFGIWIGLLSSLTVSSIAFSSRSRMAILAPLAARCNAMPRPIPRAAPVMAMTLSSINIFKYDFCGEW